MITLFSIPKPFRGHIGIIQRNAIQSWVLLRPPPEIILFGDDEGTAEVAKSFGVCHVPEVARNEYGTPLLNDLFEQAQRRAIYDILCYVNADIILMDDFLETVWRVACWKPQFLLCGQRWDIEINESLDFFTGWENRLRARLNSQGELHPPTGMDYFIFSRRLWRDIPPFAIGRTIWDNWLIYQARVMRVPVIDATGSLTAVHQNHNYLHISAKAGDVWDGPEAKRNLQLAGGWRHVFTLEDATHVLRRNRPRLALSWKHLQRYLETLPALNPWLTPLTVLTKPFVLGSRLVRSSSKKNYSPGRSIYMQSNDPSRRVQAVSVVGLGKLGAPIAACFAHKGYSVIGVDVNPQTVRLINEGRAPIFEPQLEELIRANRQRLVATEDYEKAVLGSEITFIVLPTPSDDHGGFSLRSVLAACERVGEALRKKDYHLVVLMSTVLPGATEDKVRPILEARSGKRCGSDFGLCYSPEFIALGSVIRDLLNPDFLLIGESDPQAGERLASFCQTVCDNRPPIARMNTVNAEITKLAVNTFVTTKISFANMLARVCERLPGADADVVTSALGLDNRIGSKYLKGAIGYGGPCFPRDNLAFSFLAQQLGIQAALAEATDRANREEVRRLAALVKSKRPQGGTVGILGLAYKPNTDVVVESQGFLLAQILAAEGIPVIAYDPAAMGNARRLLTGLIRFAESPEATVQQADVLVITTPWENFQHLEPALLQRHSTQRVLIDCWRILDPDSIRSVVDYIALGVGAPFHEVERSNSLKG